jgi:hypothetical protein
MKSHKIYKKIEDSLNTAVLSTAVFFLLTFSLARDGLYGIKDSFTHKKKTKGPIFLKQNKRR